MAPRHQLRLELVQTNVTDLGEAWRFYADTLGLPGAERLGRGKPFHLAVEGAPEVLVYRVERMALRHCSSRMAQRFIFMDAFPRGATA